MTVQLRSTCVDPGEALEREERRVADERAPADETLDRREHAFAGGDRQLDGTLPRGLGLVCHRVYSYPDSRNFSTAV